MKDVVESPACANGYIGIKYNIYNDETKPKYKIPGPALFSAGSR